MKDLQNGLHSLNPPGPSLSYDLHDNLQQRSSESPVQVNEQPIDRALFLVEQLMESLKNNIKVDKVHTAILILQETAEEEAHTEDSRAMIQQSLIIPLLTRFVLHGWHADLEACHVAIQGYAEILNNIQTLRVERVHEVFGQLRSSIELVKECRNSININALDDLICVAEEAVAAYMTTAAAPSPQTTNLLILLGKALIMKYFSQRDFSKLTQATSKFQVAERLSRNDISLAYISLTSLACIEWLCYIELEHSNALHKVDNYIAKARVVDEEGQRLFQLGTKFLDGSVCESQCNDAIASLSTSLRHRVAPHPKRSDVLENLGLVLYRRFSQKGDITDLEHSISLIKQALALRPTPHPDCALSLSNLALVLKSRFEAQGSLEDIENCITLQREALKIRPISRRRKVLWLGCLGTFLSLRFQYLYDYGDLEESIALARETLALRTMSDPDHIMSLNQLGSILCVRFKHIGDSNDLEESIALQRKALALTPVTHLQRSTVLSNLATSLTDRFKEKGDSKDLNESIILNKEALSLQSAFSPDRLASLHNLAHCFFLRFHFHFKNDENFEDLEDCILLYREARGLETSTHPARLLSRAALARALLDRYASKGAFEDLQESIALYREIFQIRPQSGIDSVQTINGLAEGLFYRFTRKNDLNDLDECVLLGRAILTLLPALDSNRSTYLNSLAISLGVRFDKMAAVEDIEEAISLHKEALALTPASHPLYQGPSHPWYPWILTYLAKALCGRFQCKNNLQDLEESISLYRKSLSLLPAREPDRLEVLDHLADALRRRFERLQHFEDIYEAIQCHESASKCEVSPLLARLESSKSWARLAQAHGHSSVFDAFKYSLDLLRSLPSLNLTMQHRHDILERGRTVASHAARCAMDQNEFSTAVVFLSTHRSIFWSQALQLRTPIDELAAANPALAEKFRDISRRLEQGSHASRPSHHFQPGLARHENLTKLEHQRLQIIEEIRAIPKLESFLLPPPFSSLKLAAQKGPIIFLNGCSYGYDALIMRGVGHLQRIRLAGIGLTDINLMKHFIRMSMTDGLSSTIHDAPRYAASIDSLRSVVTRDMARRNCHDVIENPLQIVLGYLWIKLVRPVIEALSLSKTNSPRRIWWCLTGGCTSLPIHAAGLYDDDEQPLDCLFEYAVSSYCTSPQDLIHPSNPVQEFKMTAIFEPEAPGAPVLPATLAELKQIEEHLPDQQHLFKHVGSKNNPNGVDDLLADIGQSTFVHFGCHGTQNMDNPLESYLLLSGGRLSMSRLIKECQVGADALAYLSACETAKGDEDRPDESFNLVAAMMFAGFRSVVGTLWSIADDDAPIVAGEFYRHLFRDGKSRLPDARDAAYGLHLATQKLREQGRPFRNWVPYVHYGI